MSHPTNSMSMTLYSPRGGISVKPVIKCKNLSNPVLPLSLKKKQKNKKKNRIELDNEKIKFYFVNSFNVIFLMEKN